MRTFHMQFDTRLPFWGYFSREQFVAKYSVSLEDVAAMPGVN